MKPKLYLLLKFILCFLLLYFLRDAIAVCYRSVLQLTGFLMLPEGLLGLDCDGVCSVRVVVYLSLVMVTPGLTVVRRLAVMLCGLAVFVGMDLVSIFLWPEAQPLQPVVRTTFLQYVFDYIWLGLKELLLPVLLWIIAIDKHLGLFFPDADRMRRLSARRSFSVR